LLLISELNYNNAYQRYPFMWS